MPDWHELDCPDAAGLVNRALLTKEPMTSDLTGQGPANTVGEGKLPPKEASADESKSTAQLAAETEPAQIAALKAEVSATRLRLHNQMQGLRLGRY